MRFRKGSKVEVLRKDEVPSGSWSCAVIVCSNRYYVTVRYDTGAADKAIIESVPRNLVRPCPPALRSPENWIPGDVIEVLHNSSWKMATVLKVLMKNHYLVRLVGLSNEFKVHKVDIRLRQSCLDGKWIQVGQASGSYKDPKLNELSSKSCYQLSNSHVKGVKRKLESCEETDYVRHYKRNIFQESRIVSLKTIKQGSPYHYPYATTHQGHLHWLNEKDCEYNQMAALDTSQVPEKVDNYRYSRTVLGPMCSLVDNGMTHLADNNLERIVYQGENTDYCSRRQERDDADASSVGSCSTTSSNPVKWHSRILGCTFDDADDHSSDAESVVQFHNEDGNCLASNKEELAAEIHRLELHAYRCTMEALHASGPLSWEQESLITNLRISLHISNDEHLMELRNLISDATSYPVK